MTANSTILQIFLFLLFIIRSGLLAEIRGSVCIIIIIIIIILLIWEFFTSALAEGFPHESERQQVF